jgi:hypothetical protein
MDINKRMIGIGFGVVTRAVLPSVVRYIPRAQYLESRSFGGGMDIRIDMAPLFNGHIRPAPDWSICQYINISIASIMGPRTPLGMLQVRTLALSLVFLTVTGTAYRNCQEERRECRL